jgi:hypothetical protein
VTQAVERSRYQKWKEAQDASNTGWVVSGALAGFAGYLIADRDAASEVLGVDSPALWKTLLVVFGLYWAGGLGVGVASMTAHKHTGVVYAEDRKTFALMGGFDVGRVPMLVVQLSLFGAYWLTSRMSSDPLEFARSPWVFLLTSTLIALAATKVVAERVFRRHATGGAPRRLARPSRIPLAGIRITALTPSRLELSHGRILFRLLGLAFFYGMALWLFLREPDTKAWVGIALLAVVGTIWGLLPAKRTVVLDRSARVLVARDRYLWRRPSVERHSLRGVSAVVASRETAADSQLTNVFVKVGPSTFPVIIGSRLATNAIEHAAIIGVFLDVPVYEDEKLIAPSPEPSVGDIIELVGMIKAEVRRQRSEPRVR